MNGYIFDMRKAVGHRTLIQCAASVICIDKDGRILLGKRTDDHLWSLPGGSVEIDERVEDCAKRELLEETGLTAGVLTFFCVNSGPESHHVYPNGDEVSNIETVYLCRDYHGSLLPRQDEFEAVGFFSRDELAMEDISPLSRPAIRKYTQPDTVG